MRIKFMEDCLLVNNNLILSDIHLGKDDFFEKEIFDKLNRVFGFLETEKIIVSKIVILGDLKDQFGGISDSEWRGIIKLLDFFIKKVGKNVIIIKGNHDAVLEPILKKRGIKLRDFYFLKDLCFIHGDKEINFKESKLIFMGHLHPSITLSDNYKSEKYKCFLKGKWVKREIIIVPNFTPLSGGFNLNNLNEGDDNFGILNKKELKKLDVIIYNNEEEKEHNFGKLRKFID
jgi:uncharacterized protein